MGTWGENFAAKILTKAGYKILDRNWRSKSGELDIVCFHRNTLVFVEVKTRRKNSKAYPLNKTVSKRKRETIYRLSGEYRFKNVLRLRSFKYTHCRYDLFVIAANEPPYPFWKHYQAALSEKW